MNTVHSKLAPVILFAYSRPEHTRLTVQGLLSNPEAAQTDLVVYSDAPAREAAAPAVREVRAYLRTIEGFHSVTVIEQPSNLGLARSIIAGVSEQLAIHGCAIVMEDDLVVSPYFLSYMNEGLRRYADDERVASIHGYSYPAAGELPEAFFLRGADCWGWATWSRAWRHFQPDGRVLATQLEQQGLVRQFDLDGKYPYFRMLRQQIAGKVDSWAIRWHASAYLANMLTLYPGRSHVVNIGADGSGTHCKTSVSLGDELASKPTSWSDFPVQEDTGARAAVGNYLRQLRRRLWLGRLRRLLKLPT